MIFKRRFFLELGGGDEQQPAVTVAPVKAPAEAKAPPAASPAPLTAASPAAAPAAPAPDAGSQPSASLTTAEAIAAELAAAQASRPAPVDVTFAPDCLTPGGALGRVRRRGGANLAGFKEMAKAMMGS